MVLLVVEAVKVTASPLQIELADGVTAVIPFTLKVAAEDVAEEQGAEPETITLYWYPSIAVVTDGKLSVALEAPLMADQVEPPSVLRSH